jgi:capsular exopolysaccharide synthesis family protein
VILVTSPAPADGKSTVASSLAIAMAQADQSVLLIDADFRRPSQHTIFDLPNEDGLSMAMSERRFPDVEILPSGIESLNILPCGPPPPNPVELINNGFFAKLLDDLRGRYDKIIIDSAPVMPVADSRILASLADATILVLRAGKSTRRPSLGARNELWRVRAQRIGVVVNAAPDDKRGGYGYGYGYSGYGYNSELPARNGRTSFALRTRAEVSAESD